MKALLQILFFSFFTLKAKAAGIDINKIAASSGLPNPAGGVTRVLSNFTGWLMAIFGTLAVLSFVITGIMYLIAMGDTRSQTLENAKQNFKWSIVAIATVGSAFIIIQAIDFFLKGLSFSGVG